MARSGDQSTEREAPGVFAGRKLACRRGERMIFAGLDFSLEPGGLLLLRGANGSGKSTLLRLMAALLRPEAGELAWDREAIGEEPDRHRRRLAFLGHLDALKGPLSAAENIAFWCGEAAAGPALTAFGIERLAHLPTRLISAGQRRRVALARIFASQTPLWLLDEPTNALDAEAEALFADILARHRAQGGMAVIALHGERAPPDATVLNLGDFPPLPAEAA
jgi:heme exporter protein A